MNNNETEIIEDVREKTIRLPEPGSLLVSSSPHLHLVSMSNSIQKIMLYVIIALLPGCAAGVYFFGLRALAVIVTCVVSCLFFEYVWCKIAGKPSTIGDLSAIVTGLILAMNLSAGIPFALCIVGSLVAIWIGKMLYGGLGYNPFNPGIVARVFLLISFTGYMTTWVPTRFMSMNEGFLGKTIQQSLDGITCATPLGQTHKLVAEKADVVYAQLSNSQTYWDYFIGNMPGCLGETSAFALLLGGFFLIIMRIIRWQIPFAFLATIAIFTGLVHCISPQMTPDPLFHLLTGGVVLGAFFMCTDMVTTPMTIIGGIIFAVGAGLITSVIRIWGGYPEGCSFAILLMNALTPLIDRYCTKQPFGQRQKKDVGCEKK